MFKSKKVLLISVIALLIIALSSCGDDISKDILGEWVADDWFIGSQSITFNDDNTYRLKVGSGVNQTGTYTIKGDTITCIASGGGTESTFIFKNGNIVAPYGDDSEVIFSKSK
jgi:uncharacterized lipoprotein YehR (DUF1307 family)